MTYCKLYIDDEMAIEELQRLADKGVEIFLIRHQQTLLSLQMKTTLQKKGEIIQPIPFIDQNTTSRSKMSQAKILNESRS